MGCTILCFFLFRSSVNITYNNVYYNKCVATIQLLEKLLCIHALILSTLKLCSLLRKRRSRDDPMKRVLSKSVERKPVPIQEKGNLSQGRVKVQCG